MEMKRPFLKFNLIFGLLSLLVSTFSPFAFAQSAHEIADFNKQGVEIVKNNLNFLHRNYSGYSKGFANRAQFLAHSPMPGTTIEDYFKLLKMHVEFRINIPSTLRNAFLEKGYLNQHQTGTTRGCLCPERRNQAEALLTGLPLASYSAMSAFVKPKYGSMGISGTQLFAANRYGDDVLVLRPEKILGRITYTPTDSLGIGSTFFNNQNPMFIPFEFPEIVLNQLSSKKLELAGSQIYANQYTEIQVWGVVNLDTVKEFRFSQLPPSDEFVVALFQNGIRIRKIICQGKQIGDESCLEDYLPPTAFAILKSLEEKNEAKAATELVKAIESGISPRSIFKMLPAAYQKWFVQQLIQIRGLKNQKIEDWITAIEELKVQKSDEVRLIKNFFENGDAISLLRYWVRKGKPSQDIPVANLDRVLSTPLTPEDIQLISGSFPVLNRRLQDQVAQLLNSPSIDAFKDVSTPAVFAFFPEKGALVKVSQLFLDRVSRGESPFEIANSIPSGIKPQVMQSLGECLSNPSCRLPSGSSGPLLAFYYSEIFKYSKLPSSTYLWKFYFQEIEHKDSFKQPTFNDIVNLIQARKVPLNRLFEDLDVSLKEATTAPALVPFEVAIQLAKEKENLSSRLVSSLAEKLAKLPFRAVYFPEAGMGAPAVSSYYYLDQLARDRIILPEFYPVWLFFQRIIERALQDPNTNVYRLGQSNTFSFFLNSKYQDDAEKTFAQIKNILPPHYKYIFLQTELALKAIKENSDLKETRAKAIEGGPSELKRSTHEGIVKMLKNWSRLSEDERNIFVKSLDVVPLLILEQIAIQTITRDYLARVKKYIESPEYRSLMDSSEVKKFSTDRGTWFNVFENRRVPNKIEDFHAKFQQMITQSAAPETTSQ